MAAGHQSVDQNASVVKQQMDPTKGKIGNLFQAAISSTPYWIDNTLMQGLT